MVLAPSCLSGNPMTRRGKCVGHNLAIDEFCWGALWMDVDNDTDLDLFVAEHDLLNPFGLNHLWENLGSPTMRQGIMVLLPSASMCTIWTTQFARGRFRRLRPQRLGRFCDAQRRKSRNTHLDEWRIPKWKPKHFHRTGRVHLQQTRHRQSIGIARQWHRAVQNHPCRRKLPQPRE